MVSWRLTLGIGGAAAVILLSVAAFLFQDDITLLRLNPRTPYQTYTPPPPPAYGARGAWALWPDDLGAGQADIFYVHSTTYASNKHWNAPLADRVADAALHRVAAPNEAGPFMQVGAVYGPRYRQATLFASFTHKFDGLAARELAYRDVEKAFEQFLAERPADRPIILVGYGQGGLHALGLLQYHFARDDRLRRNLAAAYIIGEPVVLSVFQHALQSIQPCASPQDVRCVIGYIDLEKNFDDEKRRHRQRGLIWDGNGGLVSQSRPPVLCVNPISWTITNEAADAEDHIGAASATGLRMKDTPPSIAGATGAQCVNGILSVDSPRQSFLRRRHWFGNHWRPQHFNLFYHDLTVDALRRVETLNAVLEEEAHFLNPIEEAVDLEVSPVNKAPE